MVYLGEIRGPCLRHIVPHDSRLTSDDGWCQEKPCLSRSLLRKFSFAHTILGPDLTWKARMQPFAASPSIVVHPVAAFHQALLRKKETTDSVGVDVVDKIEKTLSLASLCAETDRES